MQVLSGVTWKSQPLANFKRPRAEVEARLGPPVARDLDSNGIGLFDLWCVRFGCGLEVALWHLQMIDAFEIHSNEIDLDHIAFHLGVSYDELGLWTSREGEPLVKRVDPQFRVWRQDDHCNDFVVRDVTSECEATALVEEFTKRGHKQSYWWEVRKSASRTG
jgi:hypothetical protein